MELKISLATLRVVVLAVFAILLTALLARRFSAPAFATADSPANGVHVIPNEQNQLVIYDTHSRRVLTFVVVNGGAELRLRGWRDISDDGRLWDTAQLVPQYGKYGIETKTGANMQYLRPLKNNPAQGSMMATQTEQILFNKLNFTGPAATDVTTAVTSKR